MGEFDPKLVYYLRWHHRHSDTVLGREAIGYVFLAMLGGDGGGRFRAECNETETEVRPTLASAKSNELISSHLLRCLAKYRNGFRCYLGPGVIGVNSVLVLVVCLHYLASLLCSTVRMLSGRTAKSIIRISYSRKNSHEPNQVIEVGDV